MRLVSSPLRQAAPTLDGVEALTSWMENQYGLAIGASTRANLTAALSAAATTRRLTPLQCVKAMERGDDELRQSFIQAVTIHETYFFRHPEQFELLRALAHQRMREKPRVRVRALSAGCASGEETYSMAAALRAAAAEFASPPAIEVLGIDIDRPSLEKAGQGRYGRWSLRLTAPSWASLAVSGSGERWEVSDALRIAVRFCAMNLHDSFLPLLLAEESPFDFIFARNVLMYLVPKAASRVAHQLAQLLAPGGFLTLSPLDIERAPPDLAPHSSDPTFLSRRPAASIDRRVPSPSAPGSSSPSLSPHAPALNPRLGQMLAEAKLLTDRGELTRARAVCADLVRHHPEAPAALFLAALVELELGAWVAAERLLATALERDPDFALAHFALATLLQKQGRASEARARLVRLSHLLAGLSPETILSGPEKITCGWLRSLVSDHLNA